MAKSGRSLLASKASSSKAMGVVKPGVEALLLAAVALGCAQAGWSVLAPNEAGAINTATSDTTTEDPHVQFADVRSPFAPEIADLSQSHAVDALLSVIQLSGVRMAEETGKSGAFLTLADGGQRAFLVGQEVVAGVTLADVGPSYVLLAFEGGQRQLTMTSAPSYSFARAMLGLEPAPGAPRLADDAAGAAVRVEASVAAPESVFAAAAPTPVGASVSTSDADWLRTTLQSVEQRGERAHGWRAADPVPAALIEAGLRSGDVILTVNGVAPGDPALLSALNAPSVELTIDRAGVPVTISFTPNART